MSATNRAFRRRVRAWQRAQRRGYMWRRKWTPQRVMLEVATVLLDKIRLNHASSGSYEWALPRAVPKPDRRQAE